MLFLLNDIIINIDLDTLASAPVASSLGTMSFAQITALGQEMFAGSPRLQHISESSPSRLATLISAKKPEINAALFSAPAAGCPPASVTVRFASLSLALMLDLNTFQERGLLNKVLVDFHVWGKLQAAVA